MRRGGGTLRALGLTLEEIRDLAGTCLREAGGPVRGRNTLGIEVGHVRNGPTWLPHAGKGRQLKGDAHDPGPGGQLGLSVPAATK